MKISRRLVLAAAVIVVALASTTTSLATMTAGVSASGGASKAPTPRSQERMPTTSQSYRVWRGGDLSLPEHTILRPTDLSRVPYRLPVVVWGNGGCRQSNEEFRYFLTTLASHGVFIVANGAPENPFNAAELGGLANPEPQRLVDAINWALRQNATKSSPYYRRLDARRVVVMGQSCGGWEAVDASADPRVTSTIVWNSSLNPYHPTGVMDLHAPVLMAHGEAVDHTAEATKATYEAVSVPTVMISQAGAGHTGWWGGQPEAPTALMKAPLPVAVNWIAFTAYGSTRARGFFLGAGCGLCGQPEWTVTSKNWE